jgi:hypothetical protein
MKKIFYLFLFFISQFFCAQEMNATHLMGSDITYQCLGNNKYRVTVTVYRDCNGIQLQNSPLVVKCSTGANISKSFNLIETKVNDITRLGRNCPIVSKCAGSDYPYGIEQHIMEVDVDLSSFASAGCCWIILSWEQSARNVAINTGASGQNFYSEAKVNLCVTPCNHRCLLQIRLLLFAKDKILFLITGLWIH